MTKNGNGRIGLTLKIISVSVVVVGIPIGIGMFIEQANAQKEAHASVVIDVKENMHCSTKNKEAIGIIQTTLEYFSIEQQEMKQDLAIFRQESREDAKELKQLIRER